MKGKGITGSVKTFVAKKATTGIFSAATLSKKELCSIFPSLPSTVEKSIDSYFDYKLKLQQITEESILPKTLDQANRYLEEGKFSECTKTMNMVMHLIHEHGLENSRSPSAMQLLAKAYYTNGMVKSYGDLKDRSEAEKFFKKAIVLAEKCNDSELKSSADDKLRSLELSRYALRGDQQFEFEDDIVTTSSVAKRT